MPRFLQDILDTSEVWALLIPIGYMLVRKVDTKAMKEIIIYLWVALFLNIIIVLISYLANDEENYLLLKNNTTEYNIHATIRVILFSLYFIHNSQDVLRLQKKILLGFFLAFVLINFSFFESPVLLFSSRLFTAEAIIMLYFCIYYFLYTINQEKAGKLSQQPMFWTVTGISIYEAVNFFVFLLFTYLINHFWYFAQYIWYFHNVSYIILCLFITKAFYVSRVYRK
jgi:hypothetical protein